jgi:hypothetical protein
MRPRVSAARPGPFDKRDVLCPIKENAHDEVWIVGSCGFAVGNIGDPGGGARGHLQPRLLRAVLPNANCQNKGPNNPYTGDYQRRNEFRDSFAWSAGPCAQSARFYRGRDGRRHYCY